MYDFTDLTKIGKATVVSSCFFMAVVAVPLSAGVFLFIDNSTYEYSPILAISCLIYGYEWVNALLSVVVAFLTVPLTYKATVKLMSPKAELFGSARMAKGSEIKKAGLYKVNGESIIVGKYKGKTMGYNDDLHCFLSALTGSGKTQSFVIPNLLNWSGSAIVLDIKRECYDATSRYREKILKNDVFIFNPLSSETGCINPFDFIPEGDRSISFVESMAESLIIVDDKYWDVKAQQLFSGLALLLFEQGDFLSLQKSIGQVFRFMGVQDGLKDQLQEYLDACSEAGREVSPECAVLLYGFMNEEPKPRGSIVSSLSKHLKIWLDPQVVRATSKSSFDFGTFRKRRQTLYLVSSPDDLKRLNTVFRLILDTFVKENTKVGEEFKKNPDFNIPVLLMLDEFMQLGRMENLVGSLAYLRSWGVKMCSIIQSNSQLGDMYDKLANFYEENHRCTIYFRPNRTSTQRVEEMAKALGERTLLSTSKTKPEFGYTGNRTVSQSETQGYLVHPDEIRNMGDYRQFLLVDGMRPIYSNKVIAWKDRKYKKRMKHGACPLPQSILGNTVDPKVPDSQKSGGLTQVIRNIFIPDKEELNPSELDEITQQFCDAVTNHL